MWKALHDFLDSTMVGTFVSIAGLVVSASAWIAVYKTRRRFVRELGARRIADNLKKERNGIRRVLKQAARDLPDAQSAAKRCIIHLRAMQQLMPKVTSLTTAADAIDVWATQGINFSTAASTADELDACIVAINNELEAWLRS